MEAIDVIKKVHEGFDSFTSKVNVSILFYFYSKNLSKEIERNEAVIKPLLKHKESERGEMYRIKGDFLKSKSIFMKVRKDFMLYRELRKLEKWNVYIYYHEPLGENVSVICTHKEALLFQESKGIDLMCWWTYEE